jgi:hypothetical protein
VRIESKGLLGNDKPQKGSMPQLQVGRKLGVNHIVLGHQPLEACDVKRLGWPTAQAKGYFIKELRRRALRHEAQVCGHKEAPPSPAGLSPVSETAGPGVLNNRCSPRSRLFFSPCYWQGV